MSQLHERLKKRFPEGVEEIHAEHGDETAVIKRDALIEVGTFLKEAPGFRMNVLMDLTVVDLQDMKVLPRFEVVYHFYSTIQNHRQRLKIRVHEKDAVVPTLTGLWKSADWLEREAWDMYGVRFEGHPDLRRILMYEGFEGHALRKDYPYNQRQPLIGPKN